MSQLVDAWFAAMRRGRKGEEELLALFHEHAHYVEPFSGEPREHVGKPAIRACFREGWETPMPDLELLVERVDVDGDRIRATWVCSTSAWPSPIRGLDVYTLRDGLIMRLETSVEAPPNATAGSPPESPPSR